MVSPGKKVKQWPLPLLLTNLHVLIKTIHITVLGQNLQNFP